MNARDALQSVGDLVTSGRRLLLERRLERAREVFLDGIRLLTPIPPDERTEGVVETLATLHNAAGYVCRSLGRLAEALEHFTQALVFNRQVASASAVARDLTNIGKVLLGQDRIDEAMEHFAQSLKSHRQVAPWSLDVARDMTNIGAVLLCRGRLQEAQEHYSYALDIARHTAPSPLELAAFLTNMGAVLHEQGRHAEALEHYTQALDIDRRVVPGSQTVAISLNNIGKVLQDQGRLEEALEHYTQALAIYHRVASGSQDEARNLMDIGSLLRAQGKPDEALHYSSQALDIHQRVSAASDGLPGELNNVLMRTALNRDIIPEILDDLTRWEIREKARASWNSGVTTLFQIEGGPLRGEPSAKSPSRSLVSNVDRKLPGDWVDCSVFAPPSVVPGDVVFVQVFAHLVERAAEATRLAVEFDPETGRRGHTSLEVRVPRGRRLSFDLTVPGLDVENPVESLTWYGTTKSVGFSVRSRSDITFPWTTVGTVGISLDSIPIGHVKFRLALRSEDEREAIRHVGEGARRYEMAFVSYASKDRQQVLERVQMLTLLGVGYFQDVLSLDPGERWEKRLYLNIDRSDLFLLFWSKSAKRSKWVRKEAEYALSLKREDDLAPPEIKPVIIEGPPVVPPWPTFKHLHFDDRVRYFIPR